MLGFLNKLLLTEENVPPTASFVSLRLNKLSCYTTLQKREARLLQRIMVIRRVRQKKYIR